MSYIDATLTPRMLCFRAASLQADMDNFLIRAIDVATGAVTTLAGRQGVSFPFSDGVGSAATFSGPHFISLNCACSLAVVVSPIYKAMV
jgi:hypothetical protein